MKIKLGDILLYDEEFFPRNIRITVIKNKIPCLISIYNTRKYRISCDDDGFSISTNHYKKIGNINDFKKPLKNNIEITVGDILTSEDKNKYMFYINDFYEPSLVNLDNFEVINVYFERIESNFLLRHYLINDDYKLLVSLQDFTKERACLKN